MVDQFDGREEEEPEGEEEMMVKREWAVVQGSAAQSPDGSSHSQDGDGEASQDEDEPDGILLDDARPRPGEREERELAEQLARLRPPVDEDEVDDDEVDRDGGGNNSGYEDLTDSDEAEEGAVREPDRQDEPLPNLPDRDRTLPPEYEQTIIWTLFYQATMLSDDDWKALQHAVHVRSHGNESVPSKAKLFRAIFELSELRVKWISKCPKGCVSYGAEKYKVLYRCPNKDCREPRYKPLGADPSTFSLSTGPRLPKSERQPALLYSVVDPGSLFESMVANPAFARLFLNGHAHTVEAVRSDSPIVDSFSTSLGMRHLRNNLGLVGVYDIVYAFMSDATLWYSRQNPSVPVNGYFGMLRFPELSVGPVNRQMGPDAAHLGPGIQLDPSRVQAGPAEVFLHRNSPIVLAVGKPWDVPSFLETVVSGMSTAEEPKTVYNGALNREVEMSAYCIFEIGDTVEQQSTSGMVGSAGVRPCYTCMTPAVPIARRNKSGKQSTIQSHCHDSESRGELASRAKDVEGLTAEVDAERRGHTR